MFQRVNPTTDEDGFVCFAPDVEEFKLSIVELGGNCEIELAGKAAAYTLFILEGDGTIVGEIDENFDVVPGHAFFVPTNSKLKISSKATGLKIYKTSLGVGHGQ